MAGNKASGWNPPVEFYFLVDFQSDSGQRFQASFTEVNGIGWDMSTKTRITDSNGKLLIPTSMSYPNLILKRPLDTSGDEFYHWLQDGLKKMFLRPLTKKNYYRKTCDVVIKLLGKDGQPLAAWSCDHAYPIKYNVSGLDAVGW